MLFPIWIIKTFSPFPVAADLLFSGVVIRGGGVIKTVVTDAHDKHPHIRGEIRAAGRRKRVKEPQRRSEA